MLSFQGQYDLAQSLASDANATNLTLLKSLINQGNRKLAKSIGYYAEEIRTFTTVTDAISGTSYQAYRLPEDYYRLTDLYVTSGSTQYRAELIQDPDRWRIMNSTTTSSTSNFLSHCFIRPDRIELYPIPSSALTATMIYRAFPPILTAADYTTGTITTLANAGTAVTGSGTTFTSAMAGRYFKIDANGDWYKIASYGSATTLTLQAKYQGVAISAGTEPYTIGQMANLPPGSFEIPVEYALWKYELFRKNVTLAREHKRAWDEGLLEATGDWANRSSSQIISSNPGRSQPINPNYYPENMS